MLCNHRVKSGFGVDVRQSALAQSNQAACKVQAAAKNPLTKNGGFCHFELSIESEKSTFLKQLCTLILWILRQRLSMTNKKFFVVCLWWNLVLNLFWVLGRAIFCHFEPFAKKAKNPYFKMQICTFKFVDTSLRSV